jgi:hypothetical protein
MGDYNGNLHVSQNDAHISAQLKRLLSLDVSLIAQKFSLRLANLTG